MLPQMEADGVRYPPGFPMPRDPLALTDRSRRPIVRRQSEPRFPFPVPNGWFVVAESSGLAPGEHRNLYVFGTDVVLKHGDIDPVEGAILLSPPLRFSTDADLDRWAASGRPLTALVPELDDYLRPDEARARFARVPQAEVVGVEGAKHLWVGEKYVKIVLGAIAEHLVPGMGPLPDEYDGPMERWSDL